MWGTQESRRGGSSPTVWYHQPQAVSGGGRQDTSLQTDRRRPAASTHRSCMRSHAPLGQHALLSDLVLASFLPALRGDLLWRTAAGFCLEHDVGWPTS